MQKGIDVDKIVILSPIEKIFYAASMELAFEEEAEKYKTLAGGGR